MFTDSQLALALALHGQAMRVPKSAVIYDAGDTADGIYIVTSGQVKVQLVNNQQVPVWTRTVSDSGILGLPAAIGHHAHRTRAVASENTDIIFVDAITIADLIRNDPKLGGQVLMLISEEISELRRKVVMLRGN
jgi:CRP-like cAMP-binding protein